MADESSIGKDGNLMLDEAREVELERQLTEIGVLAETCLSDEGKEVFKRFSFYPLVFDPFEAGKDDPVRQRFEESLPEQFRGKPIEEIPDQYRNAFLESEWRQKTDLYGIPAEDKIPYQIIDRSKYPDDLYPTLNRIKTLLVSHYNIKDINDEEVVIIFLVWKKHAVKNLLKEQSGHDPFINKYIPNVYHRTFQTLHESLRRIENSVKNPEKQLDSLEETQVVELPDRETSQPESKEPDQMSEEAWDYKTYRNYLLGRAIELRDDAERTKFKKLAELEKRLMKLRGVARPVLILDDPEGKNQTKEVEDFNKEFGETKQYPWATEELTKRIIMTLRNYGYKAKWGEIDMDKVILIEAALEQLRASSKVDLEHSNIYIVVRNLAEELDKDDNWSIYRQALQRLEGEIKALSGLGSKAKIVLEVERLYGCAADLVRILENDGEIRGKHDEFYDKIMGGRSWKIEKFKIPDKLKSIIASLLDKPLAWKIAVTLFETEGEKILTDVPGVLIPRILAINYFIERHYQSKYKPDNSR